MGTFRRKESHFALLNKVDIALLR